MLRVPARTGPSAIHGTGVFATEKIPCGTVIWVLDRGLDREFTPDELEQLSPDEYEQIKPYLYVDLATGKSVLCGDDARYMNHADSPNTSTRGNTTVTIRDVEAGEELTADYAEFDARTRQRLGLSGEPRSRSG